MEIKGNYILPCDPQRAWEALNDPELLQACIKGCERLEKTAEGKFEGTVQAKVGPVSARFNGSMTQTEVDAPQRCTMVFEGQGGVAGFAKGTAQVNLDECEGGTQLTYNADAKIGGKLAQMGARLVEGTARNMAEDFFGKFSAALAKDNGVGAPEQGKNAPAAKGTERDIEVAETGSNRFLIVIITLIAILAGIYLLS